MGRLQPAVGHERGETTAMWLSYLSQFPKTCPGESGELPVSKQSYRPWGSSRIQPSAHQVLTVINRRREDPAKVIRGPQNDNPNPAHTAARAGALAQQWRSELREQELLLAALGPGPHWPHSSLCPHSPSENGHFVLFTPFTWVHPLTVHPGRLPWVHTTLVPLSCASKHLIAPHLLMFCTSSVNWLFNTPSLKMLWFL